jgi:phosphatidylserine/phosphatidylglycerophosphate/cardiolipin synthase-like enzyme
MPDLIRHPVFPWIPAFAGMTPCAMIYVVVCRMAEQAKRMIRWMAPLAVLLTLFAPTLAFAEPATKNPDPAAQESCGAKLLKDENYFPALLEGIDQARQEIALTVFFFKTNGFADNRPDRILLRLREAVRRGVRVDVVIEQGQEGENVSRVNADAIRKLRTAGIRVCMDAPDRTMHTKMVVIDRRTLFIGSHNLTQSALKYNSEVSVRIVSPPMAEEALRYMKSLCR